MTRPRTLRRILVAGPAFRPWDLGVYVERALSRHRVPSARLPLADHPDAASKGEALVRAVRNSGADAVVGLKLEGVPAEAVREVRRRGVRVLLWQVDCFTARAPRWIVPLVRSVDVVAVTGRGLVDVYSRLGPASVHWVPEGVFLPAFPPVTLTPGARRLFGSDIAFVGGLRQPPVANRALAGRRVRLLDRLGRHHDVKVWGPQPAPAIRDASRRAFTTMTWPAYHRDLVRICHASAIVLGVNTINTVHQYFSNRTFLTLACGGFHVTHYVPGLEELFDNHEHLVWFEDDEECLDVCRHYLPRVRLRRRIAERGRRLVRRRWGLVRQVGRILDLVEGRTHGS